MTPAGIEPATFRLVKQYLNHCATAVPIALTYDYEIMYKLPTNGSHTYPGIFILYTQEMSK